MIQCGWEMISAKSMQGLLFLYYVNPSGEGFDLALFGQFIEGIAHLTGLKASSFLEAFHRNSVAAFADHAKDAV